MNIIKKEHGLDAFSDLLNSMDNVSRLQFNAQALQSFTSYTLS